MAWCGVAWCGQNCVGRSFDFGMLSRVTTLATQSITSGVQTSAMITGMAAAGGGLRSLSGLRDPRWLRHGRHGPRAWRRDV